MKRKKKVLKLKKGIKTALIIIGIYAVITAYLFIANARVENIQNNPNGYTKSGHAHSVQINFNK